MAFRNRRREKEQPTEVVEQKKILDVDASMQGSLTFRDPVNLRINGKFEGSLDTKGELTVGENAHIQAKFHVDPDLIVVDYSPFLAYHIKDCIHQGPFWA